MFNRVQDLLFRAEFFLEAHKSLRAVLLKCMPSDPVDQTNYFAIPIVNLAFLNANLYFFESVSCVASLLRDPQSDPTKDEISFHGLVETIPDEAREAFRRNLMTIFAEYKTSRLKELRDKIVDHKDLMSIGDPTADFINPPVERLIDTNTKIVTTLKRMYSEAFPDAIANNYFSGYYSGGINDYIQRLTQTLGK